MTQNKSELRISMLFLFRHCFMLPSPTPLSHDFNNLKCYPCRFLSKFFFYVSPLAGFFLDKFPLQEFFLEIVTPPPVISNGPSLTAIVFF